MKFAKYLKRHGKEVYVLAARMNVDKQSPWDDDAREVEHLTSRLHFTYKVPYYKRTTASSLTSRLKWHASKWYHRLGKEKQSTGNPADTSEVYAPAFLKKAKELIGQKKIATVVFTASPNHLAYHLSSLKKEYPQVKFIFDLRDYWSDWMTHLDAGRQAYEAGLEKETILNSDLIYSPAKRILDTLKQRYPEKAASMKLLPHAFDQDDFREQTGHASAPAQGVTRLVYAGTMYDHMEDNMRLLVRLLNSDPSVELTFYTFTEDYREFFKEHPGRVHYLKPLPVKEFTLRMQQEADAMLYMRSTMSDDSNFLSSKFFDFLPLKIPIIYLGNEGDALDFIRSENIGFHLNPDTMGQVRAMIRETAIALQQFSTEPYSFESVTRQLEQDIES